MDPRLAETAVKLQSLEGATTPPDEIAARLQYVVAGLQGRPLPPLPPQSGGGGRLPPNLATRAKQGLPWKGGANPMGDFLQSKAKELTAPLPPSPPTLASFLESQGIPQIPIDVKRTPGDFLGNAARWWVEAASTPYLGSLMKLTFFFLFFLSYVESTPLVGRALSVALDLSLAGGRVLIKSLQAGLPTLMGLLPFPYAHVGGVALATVIGMFTWIILAIVSFSRQDFTSAVESMLRIIPLPLGPAIADAFLDLNRTWDRIGDKGEDLTKDLWNGLMLIQQILSGISGSAGAVATEAVSRAQSGADKLLTAIKDSRPPPVVVMPPTQYVPVPVAQPVPVPVAQPVPVPVAQPTPDLFAQPPVSEPPVPEPVSQPVPEPPVPEPLPEPVSQPPVPEQPPVFEAGPRPALDRLRSGESVNRDLNVGRGLRGGKRLSTKTPSHSKWTTPEQQLFERFFGAGSR